MARYSALDYETMGELKYTNNGDDGEDDDNIVNIVSRSPGSANSASASNSSTPPGKVIPEMENKDVKRVLKVKGKRGSMAAMKREVYNPTTPASEQGEDSWINTPDLTRTDPDYIIKFIRRVKSVPMVYNQEDPNFRNIPEKNRAWKKIAQEFNQNQAWCMKKWISLRDYYVKRKKLHSLGRPARPWIYFNELKFLQNIYGNDPPPPVLSPNKPLEDLKVPKAETVTYTLSEDFFPYYDEGSNSDPLSNDGEPENEEEYEFENEVDEEDGSQVLDNNVPYFKTESPPDDYYSSNHSSASPSKKPRLEVFANPLSIVNMNKKSNANNTNTSGPTSSRHHTQGHSQNYNHHPDRDSEERDEDEEQVFEIEREPMALVESSLDIGGPDNRNSGVSSVSTVSVVSNTRNSDSNSRNQSRDPFDLFCLSVAAQMRSMPRAKALQLQVKIMELMYDTEYPQMSCD